MEAASAAAARHEGGGVARVEARWERLAQGRDQDEQQATALWAEEQAAARREAFLLVPAGEVVVSTRLTRADAYLTG